MERKPDIEWNLIARKILGLANGPEEEEFKRWCDADVEHRRYYEKARSWFERYYSGLEEREVNREQAWNDFRRYTEKPRVVWSGFRWVKYAAVLILPLVVGWMAFRFLSSPEISGTADHKILPGKRLATLTLGDGRQIRLSEDAPEKILVTDGKVIINQNEQGIHYNSRVGEEMGKEQKRHVLTVPRGGEYRLTLSDGTKIVLNADSHLVFPEVFGKEERQVELRGEAYFEVAGDQQHPFVVKTASGEIRVLGTVFNLSAYPEDERVEMTLVEGKVAFQAVGKAGDCVLQAGEQLVYERESRKMQLKKVDPRLYTSWKEGKFIIEAMRLEDIMRRLARWYNVEVFYQNSGVKELVFSGDLERYGSCEEILNIISLSTHVHFSVQGRTVMVY